MKEYGKYTKEEYTNEDFEMALLGLGVNLSEFGLAITVIQSEFGPMHDDFTVEHSNFLHEITQDYFALSKKIDAYAKNLISNEEKSDK